MDLLHFEISMPISIYIFCIFIITIVEPKNCPNENKIYKGIYFIYYISYINCIKKVIIILNVHICLCLVVIDKYLNPYIPETWEIVQIILILINPQLILIIIL